MHLKISSAKWRPFCSGGDETIVNSQNNYCQITLTTHICVNGPQRVKLIISWVMHVSLNSQTNYWLNMIIETDIHSLMYTHIQNKTNCWCGFIHLNMYIWPFPLSKGTRIASCLVFWGFVPVNVTNIRVVKCYSTGIATVIRSNLYWDHLIFMDAVISWNLMWLVRG